MTKQGNYISKSGTLLVLDKFQLLAQLVFKLVADFTIVSLNLKPMKFVTKLVTENHYVTGLINKIFI